MKSTSANRFPLQPLYALRNRRAASPINESKCIYVDDTLYRVAIAVEVMERLGQFPFIEEYAKPRFFDELSKTRVVGPLVDDFLEADFFSSSWWEEFPPLFPSMKLALQIGGIA
ncbi:hypothetical protein SESBI_07240 [Sesbania bispinosa]|nr:hypothetical protein SESBI_07240 [Sesbania bispinosa]